MAKPIDPEKYYQIYADHFVRKLNYREIAELRGISIGTISNAVKWVDEQVAQFTPPELHRGAIESTRDRLKWLKEQSRYSLKRVKKIQAIEEQEKRELTEREERKMRSRQNSYLRFNSAISGVETHLHQLQGLLKGMVLFDEGGTEIQVAGFTKEFQELINWAKKNADKKGAMGSSNSLNKAGYRNHL